MSGITASGDAGSSSDADHRDADHRDADRRSEAPPSPDLFPGWATWVDQSCRMVEAAGQWRRPRAFDALGPAGLLDAGLSTCSHRTTPVVSFASNDYLGLASDPDVVAAAHQALDRWGAGAGASRLVTGSRPVHHRLEEELAAWKGCQQAVVLPTGFAANLSVLTVFGTEGAQVFSDELNHASIIDGCRMSRAGVTVYPHRDLAFLDAALGRSPGRPIIVSDTVFSMDGDTADLRGLSELARRSRRMARQSRWRVTTQKPISFRWIGAHSRRSA